MYNTGTPFLLVTDGQKLEHLENVFYKQALSQFSQQDFANAGFSSSTFDNIKFIAHDEEAHVVFLTSAISSAGASPVAACTYNFGNALSDVQAFVGLASVLEGVGVSAYLGGAAVISSKDILAVAAAVLVSEGLHQGIQRQALGETASANIAGTALDPNAIFTLASTFISSCPSTNAALPFSAFPILNAVTAQPIAANATQMFSVGGSIPGDFFVTFVSGLDTVSVAGTNTNGMIAAAVPAQIEGQTYAFVTSSAVATGGSIQDSQVLFGPAILEVTPGSPTIDDTIMKR